MQICLLLCHLFLLWPSASCEPDPDIIVKQYILSHPRSQNQKPPTPKPKPKPPSTTEILPEEGYGSLCGSVLDCGYDNSVCVNDRCGCTEQHGPSLTTDDCVAMLEGLQYEFQMEGVPFNENLNDPASQEYADISGTIDLVVTSVTNALVDGDLDVFSVTPVEFVDDPEEGTVLVLQIELYNPDFDKSTLTKRSTPTRLLRSTTNTEASDKIKQQAKKLAEDLLKLIKGQKAEEYFRY